MPKDLYEWHDLYNTEPKLQQRLEIVQEYIAFSHSLTEFWAKKQAY